MIRISITFVSLVFLIGSINCGAFREAREADSEEDGDDRIVDLQQLLRNVDTSYRQFGKEIGAQLSDLATSLRSFKQDLKDMQTAISELKKSSTQLNSFGQDIKQSVDKSSALINGFGQTLVDRLDKSSSSIKSFGQVIENQVKTSSDALTNFGSVFVDQGKKTSNALASFETLLRELFKTTSNTCNGSDQDKILTRLNDLRDIGALLTKSNQEIKEELGKSFLSINTIANGQNEMKVTLTNNKNEMESIAAASKDIKNSLSTCANSFAGLIKEQQTLKDTITNQITGILDKVEKTCDNGKDNGNVVDTGNEGDGDDNGEKNPDAENQGKVSGVDCTDVYRKKHRTSGIYYIKPHGSTEFPVFCDMADGGGWTVIQRRSDFGLPSNYFSKTWHEYKDGFGVLTKEFWLGNDKIAALTGQDDYQLRIDLWDTDSNRAMARYNDFKVEDDFQQFTLRVTGYSGNAGDALKHHNNLMFSTKDRDNSEGGRCQAEWDNGGWWYGPCQSNLNGLKLGGKNQDQSKGIKWSPWLGHQNSLAATTMKIRPKDFNF